MDLYFNQDLVPSVDAAILRYRATEFESPTRSTVPLLSWLKHEQPMLGELLQALGMPPDCTLHLEYTVAPPQGHGKASHTDLMIQSPEAALALEAKWTEPRYETVAKWMTKGTKPQNRCQNRCNVLAGWLSLLQPYALRPLHIKDFTDAVYQMVHRAASACADNGRAPRMAYLVFQPSPSTQTVDTRTMRADLSHLWHLLGCPPSFPFYFMEMHIHPTPTFRAIASLKKGCPDTAHQVRLLLGGSEQLFMFEKCCVAREEETP